MPKSKLKTNTGAVKSSGWKTPPAMAGGRYGTPHASQCLNNVGTLDPVIVTKAQASHVVPNLLTPGGEFYEYGDEDERQNRIKSDVKNISIGYRQPRVRGVNDVDRTEQIQFDGHTRQGEKFTPRVVEPVSENRNRDGDADRNTEPAPRAHDDASESFWLLTLSQIIH